MKVSTWFANARRRLKKENKMTWSPRNRTAEDDDEDDENVGDAEEDEDDDDLLDSSTTIMQLKTTTDRPSSSISIVSDEATRRIPLHFGQSEQYSQQIFQQLVNQQLFSQTAINEELKKVAKLNNKNETQPKKIWSIEETLNQAKRCKPSCSPEIKVNLNFILNNFLGH